MKKSTQRRYAHRSKTVARTFKPIDVKGGILFCDGYLAASVNGALVLTSLRPRREKKVVVAILGEKEVQALIEKVGRPFGTGSDEVFKCTDALARKVNAPILEVNK